MNEITMAYLWKNQLFSKWKISLTNGDPVQILHPGVENIHAGADFQQAKIRINDLLWIGAVELHVRSSDWNLHGHQTDQSYENVILHVVWEDDREINYLNEQQIPTLCLSAYVHPNQKILMHQQENSLACGNFFASISNETKITMLERCLEERLKEKISYISLLLKDTQYDWEEACYQSLARSFGFSLNAEPMLRLAQNCPLKLILRYRDRPYATEAILFGLAGLLEEPVHDAYQWELRREYIHLKKKHQLAENYLHISDWKLLRLRPSNFPSIRLAQFAAVVQSNCSLISLLLEMQDLKTVRQLFDIPTIDYWSNHTHFGKKSNTHQTKLGQGAFESICMNTLIPLLFAYSETKQTPVYAQKARRWLSELKPENNIITRKFTALTCPMRHAADSQASLQWHKSYCVPKKCLACTVGQEILSPT
jgi:hypothetical protein